MARIRTVKPEFWTDEDLSELPPETHLLATQVNDCGFTYVPATLTLSYVAADLPVGTDESSLVIVRFDGTTLERMTDVVVDAGAGTVQVSVPGFSSFAICRPSAEDDCGAASVDLAASLTGSAETVDAGGSVTYTLTVTNQGPDALELATAVIVANGEADYAAGFTAPDGCALASGGTGIGFSCGLTKMPVGETRSFELPVQTTGGGTVEAIGGLLSPNGYVDPEPRNDQDTVTTSVTPPEADLSFALAQDPADLNGGQPATFTFSVTNPSAFDADGVSYYMTIFGDVTAAAGWSLPDGCELGNVVDGGADIGIMCRPVTVPAGGAVSEELTVDIATSETVLRVLGGINDIGNVADSELVNNEYDEFVGVTPAPVTADLAYGVTSDPADLAGGAPATFTFSVSNPAAEEVGGVSFFLNLFGDVTAAGTWSVPDGCQLASGGTADIGLLCGPVSVPAGGATSRDLTVDIGAAETAIRLLGGIADPGNADDPELANNDYDQTVSVTPAPVQTDLAISYALDPSPPTAGGEVAATVTVANLGAEDAANVVWVMNFNNGVSVAAGYTAPSGCQLGSPADASVDGAGLLCGGVAIPAGGSASETLNIAVADTASLVEVLGGIQDFGTIEDTNADNNSVSETVTVQAATADPLIVLEPDSVTFDVVAGGAAPPDQAVTILNGGGGTLDGLAVAVSYEPGDPTGWLTASIFSGGGSNGVILSADQSGLAQGTYAATVSVTDPDAANSPQELPVVLNVQPAADLGIDLATPPASVDVGTTIEYEVTVTNAGPSFANNIVFTLFVEGTLLSPGPEFTPEGCSLFTSPPDADPAKLYQCAIPTLAAGGSATFTLPLIPQESGETLSAAATIQSLEDAVDLNPVNDIDVGETTVN